MNIANRTVLITGANGGIGRALVDRRLDGERRGYMRERAANYKLRTSAWLH
jgi:NAD(P)-dependent dehydrogenase (short-subunit alcohol dehydrogenase family)